MRRAFIVIGMLVSAGTTLAAAAPTPLTRPATREEGIERSIAGNDIVCLARVLRVARLAPTDTTGHLAHFASIEPIEWVKGALDYQDSLTVYLPADGDRTARALKAIAASRGDGALLLFSDAGGYWLVDRTSASACGDHLGVVRVPAGHGKSALTRYRAWADRVSLAGLARRADLVVVAECAPGPRFALATVSESLKGAAPRDTLRIAQCCEPIAGRQLLFLRRVGAGAFEPLPFALPLRQAGMARNPNALSDEIEQVRESMREAEEHE